jgi:hypothetical protein
VSAQPSPAYRDFADPLSGGAGGPHNGVRLALAAVQLLRAIAVIVTSHDRPWWWPWT